MNTGLVESGSMHGGELQMAGAGLCLILGGVGAIISYRIKGATEQTAMIGGTGCGAGVNRILGTYADG